MPEKNDLSNISYTLGVLSIVFGIVSPLAGLIIGIIGLVMSKKQKNDLTKKAKKLNIVGIILSIIMIIISIILTIILKDYMGNLAGIMA